MTVKSNTQAPRFGLKVAMMASVGSGLEYYDFVIFLFLSKWISAAFFPNHHPGIAMLKTLGIFFLGALIRPLGSYLIGLYADRTGRRTSFFLILFLMAGSTLGLALCPTYDHIGALAPVLLIIFRLIQCISFGSDLPTGMILLAEHSPSHRRGWYCGILIMNVAFGSALGTGVSYVLLHHFSDAQMQAYGWRLGFIFGVAINLIAFFFRRKIHETPLFNSFKQRIKQSKAFKIDIKACLQAGGILLLPAALIMLQTTFPITLPKIYPIKANKIYLYLTWFGLIEAILIPFFGLLSDYVNRRTLYGIPIIGWLLIMPALFYYCLNNPTNLNLMIFFGLYTLFVGIFAGSFFVLIAECFPTRSRVAQYALSYNTVYLIMAAIPLYTTWLVVKGYWISGTLTLLCILAIMSFITTWLPGLSKKSVAARWEQFE